MGMTHFTQKKVLDSIFGRTAIGEPATWYLALFTVAPTNAGGGTEVSTAGTGYARKAITNNTTNFPAATGGDPASKALAVAQAFGLPSANWGEVVAFGWMDASSGGNCWYWDELENAWLIENGDAAPSVAANALSVTQTGV